MFIQLLQRLRSSLAQRRQHPRVPNVIPVEFRLFGSAVRHISTTRDLSSRGTMLEAVSQLPVGSPLVLAFPTNHGPVERHGRVAWSAAAGMGVRFTGAAL